MWTLRCGMADFSFWQAKPGRHIVKSARSRAAETRADTMKLLLKKNVKKLGIVGDLVEVADGYGRNYLLPMGLATEPTEANMRALAGARRAAEEEREREYHRLAAVAERIRGLEITIARRANEEGVLYGSVSRRDIAAALNAEGHEVTAEHVILKDPIRLLDNVTVTVRLTEEHEAEVKVWVVREREGDDEVDTAASAEKPKSRSDEAEPEAVRDGEGA